MRTSRKAILIVLLLVVAGIFGYSQYIAISHIGAIVTENEFLEKNDFGSIYNIQLEFNNPSLLILSAGKTDFTILVEDIKTAEGVLDPFVLPPLSKTIVRGTYLEDEKNGVQESQSSSVKISGITKYDIFFISVEIPFIYFPSDDQAREFIHQN
jgi:hypothetical protein